jgi:hypothetical protein
VTIDGIGFVAPVAVTLGGFAAQPISVTGTKLIVISNGALLSSCADVRGPTIVTNIGNGDFDEGPDFIYRVPRPTIVNVQPNMVAPGDSITVTVANAQPGINRFELRGLEAEEDEDADIKTVFPTSQTIDENGTGTFVLPVPLNWRFETGSCTVAGQPGERTLDLFVDITYLNIQSRCTDTAEDVLTIDVDNGCVQLPNPELTQTSPPPPNCAVAPSVAVGGSSNVLISFSNSGTAALVITPNAPTGPQAGEFVITPPTMNIAPGDSGSFNVTFTPTAPGSRNAIVTFTTNDPDEGTVTICLQGTGL